jgi:hypothetical protein
MCLLQWFVTFVTRPVCAEIATLIMLLVRYHKCWDLKYRDWNLIDIQDLI